MKAAVEASLSSASSSSSSSTSTLRSSFIQNNNNNNRGKNISNSKNSQLLLLSSPSIMKKKKKKKSSTTKRKSIFSLRMILAILATIAVGSTLYYDSNVSSNFQRAVESASSMMIYNTKQQQTQSQSQHQSQQSEPLTIQQETAIQKYDFDKDNSADSSSSSQKWTVDERNSMRQYFRNDIQKQTSKEYINKTNALFWDVDFKNIFLYLKKQSNKQNIYKFYDMFPEQKDVTVDPKILSIAWGLNGDDASQTQRPQRQRPRIIHTMNLCHAYKQSKKYGNNFNTPHVLFTHINENWGALSTEIKSRTGNWGNLLEQWDGEDCHWSLVLKDYINSPNTLAIFTTQHQSLYDHPKIYSIPIGIASDKGRVERLLFLKQKIYNTQIQIQIQNQKQIELEKLEQNQNNATDTMVESHSHSRQRRRRLQDIERKRERELAGGSVIKKKKEKEKTKEEEDSSDSSDESLRQKQEQEHDEHTQLLMINSNPTPTRKPQMDAVINNFSKLGYKKLKNNYGQYKGNSEVEYLKEISNSKFILCPSGLGWDTYRIWEALNLGTIPVIERHVYKYELITYPIELNKLPKLTLLISDGDNESKKKKKKKRQNKEKFQHINKYNATYEIIEYEDGWHNSLKGLPIVWIDGQFSDRADDNNDNNATAATTNNNKYLTPQLLENEYDKFAIQAIKNEFQYEKLTSTYWINLIESFLLIDDNDMDNNNNNNNNTSSSSSWSLHNYRSYDDDGDDNDNNDNEQDNHDDGRENNNNHAGNDDKTSTSSSSSSSSSSNSADGDGDLTIKIMIGWTIIIWEIFISFKIIGIILIVIAVRRLRFRFFEEEKQSTSLLSTQHVKNENIV